VSTLPAHRIEAARFIPGAGPADLPAIQHRSTEELAHADRLIRGRALIFWDRSGRRPGKKLDAIDTDQITPAKDCVSVISCLISVPGCTPERPSSSPETDLPSGAHAR